MKKILVLSIIFGLFLTSCVNSVSTEEQKQQESGNLAIVQNQPIPDLGGYSFERQILIETYLARNNTISTFAYLMTLDGKIIEICPSIGYPIPYSTQLTNPIRVEGSISYGVTVANAEPNSLYPPSDAAATLVQCVGGDGKVSPVYIEHEVMAFPFRIASDMQLTRIGEPSFTVDLNK